MKGKGREKLYFKNAFDFCFFDLHGPTDSCLTHTSPNRFPFLGTNISNRDTQDTGLVEWSYRRQHSEDMQGSSQRIIPLLFKLARIGFYYIQHSFLMNTLCWGNGCGQTIGRVKSCVVGTA